MTAESLKIFGCPTCGFRVGEDDSSCPRCGHSFSEGTRFECPFCGELVEHGSVSCPSCHVNYPEFREKSVARGGDESIDQLLVDIIKLEAESAGHDTKKFSCPVCSWLLDGSELTCPRCGKEFSEDVSFQCPICGSTVPADTSECPECGSSFEDVTEPEDQVLADSSADEPAQETEPQSVRTFEETMAPVPSEEPTVEQPEWPSPDEPVRTEPEPEEKESPAATSTLEEIASTLNELTDQVEEESEPKAIPKPIVKPKQVVILKTIVPPEPAKEKKAAPSGGQKKSRQRKLKAKPQARKTK